MKCPICGYPVKSTDKLCRFCGMHLGNNAVAEAPYEEKTIVVEMPPTITITGSPQLVVHPPRVIRTRILGWKTVPELKYRIPILPAERAEQKEKGYIVGLIEGEGSFGKATDIRGRRLRIRPYFLLRMKEKPQ